MGDDGVLSDVLRTPEDHVAFARRMHKRDNSRPQRSPWRCIGQLKQRDDHVVRSPRAIGMEHQVDFPGVGLSYSIFPEGIHSPGLYREKRGAL